MTAAATAVAGAVAGSDAYAGSNLRGPRLTGVALRSFEVDQPVVIKVSVRSGETERLSKQPKR